MLDFKVGQVYFNKGNALYYLVTKVGSAEAHFETFRDAYKIGKEEGSITYRYLDDFYTYNFELFRDVEPAEEAKDFKYGDTVYLLPDTHASYEEGEEGVAAFREMLTRHNRVYSGQWQVLGSVDSDGDVLIEQEGYSYYVLTKFLSREPVKVVTESVEAKEAEPMSEELSSESCDCVCCDLEGDMGSVSVKALVDAAYYVGLEVADLSKLVSLAKRLDNN